MRNPAIAWRPAMLLAGLLLCGCQGTPGKGGATENPNREPERADRTVPAAPRDVPGVAPRAAVEPDVLPPEDELKRRDAARLYDKAARFEQEGRLEEAFENYRSAVKVFPRYAAAHVGIGNIYLMKQRYAEAESAYKAALKYDARSATAHNNLAWLYVTTRTQLPRASELAQKAIDLTRVQLQGASAAGRAADVDRLQVELAECWSTLGWSHFYGAEHLGAVMAWDQAAQTLPPAQSGRKALFLYRMALALSLQGDPARALRAIVQARSLAPDAALLAKLDALETSLGSK